ncbi:MAG: Coenzyme F420 hydrogenase/dehydrogenase, beta subunit C-terminal domain [Dehalococcoidales bacterium]|nr:Coenzyme F420 hydrogenase/dehydrogenase, beta subunit C-terminal domain [Dehalococcoidales bacterium]
MKGDMYIARAADKDILKRGENGGVVTSLLKFALESKRVDAVVAVKAREGNRYDGIPVLITEPEKVLETAGSLHSSSPNIARLLTEYLDGASNLKLAVVVKPCDARAIIELAKRTQINLDNLLLIGLNCTGTLPSVKAKTMMKEIFEVDPAEVVGEDIEDNVLTITLKDGSEKKEDLAKLEEQGYGRRENCRRCEINIPVMADIACGKWGTTNKETTFIETCSEKGAQFIQSAVDGGCITVEEPSTASINDRKKKDQAAIELAKQWQDKDFSGLEKMSTEERFSHWFAQFGQCIKCYGCRDACPICYCKDCFLEADRGYITPGEIPPDVMFPMVRVAHVMDSCVNCGQCEDVCTMDVPISLLVFLLNKKMSDIFKYEPGMDVTKLPPLRTTTDQELKLTGVDISFDF